jgi:hypothetical protein
MNKKKTPAVVLGKVDDMRKKFAIEKGASGTNSAG